jgi:ferrochelatase
MSTTGNFKRGLLLANLGTPDDPNPPAVGRYLNQFLMDKWVIDIPYLLRWILVKILIVPKRKYKSSAAYKQIWTSRGSPLLFNLKDLQVEVAKHFPGWKTAIAMRYGSPSIESGIRELLASGVEEIVVFSMYPQYAESSTRTMLEECERVLRGSGVRLRFIKDYFDHPSFIAAYAEVCRTQMQGASPQHWLMSFHGLPERHIKRTDPTGAHCLIRADCCDKMVEANRDCYRAQSFATARLLAAELGLSRDQYTVSFQSRLGRTPWIKPFTDFVLPEFPSKGVKNLTVVCPSFTADCLETIEEIGIRASAIFREAGGEMMTRVPCLNASPLWAKAIADIIS